MATRDLTRRFAELRVLQHGVEGASENKRPGDAFSESGLLDVRKAKCLLTCFPVLLLLALQSWMVFCDSRAGVLLFFVVVFCFVFNIFILSSLVCVPSMSSVFCFLLLYCCCILVI